MDKLKSLIPKISKAKPSNILSAVIVAVIGLIMGCGSFMMFISTFGLQYSIKEAFTGGVSGGLISIWNSIIAKLAEDKGLFYDQLQGASGEYGLCLTLILLFLVALAVLITVSRNRWFAVIYPVFAIIPTLIWGMHGSLLSFAILTAGVLLFLYYTTSRNINYSGMIYIVTVCLIGFVLFSVPGISKLTDKPDKLKAMNENIHQYYMESHYGTNVLDEGYLFDKKRAKAKGTALEVDMADPKPMYLRGYVGDILNDEGWEPLSNSVYYQSRDLMYWLNQSGFNGLGQLQESAKIAYSGGKKKLNSPYKQKVSAVTVKNKDANSRYAYIPYGMVDGAITGADGQKTKNQNWGDNFITGKGHSVMDEYSYSTVTGLTDKWTEIASRYFTNKVNIPDYNSYKVSESNYNDFVYKNYRYISDDQLMTIKEIIPDDGDQKRGHVEYNQAVKNVKAIVNTYIIYSDNLQNWKKNISALDNIVSSENGYDAHYATLATLLFRYYGIPARYVEGYLITAEDIAKAGNGPIEVSRANNHAWCEIYVDGVGFVPVETCSRYSGLMPEADYNIGITNKTKKDTKDNTPQMTEDPNDIQSLSNSYVEKKVPNKVLSGIGILVALICLAAIVTLMILLIRKIKAIIKRRKLFKKGEPREAIRAIYAYMDKKGISPDNQAVEIGNRASYSLNMVTAEERDIMRGKLKKDKKNKKDKKEKKEKKKGIKAGEKHENAKTKFAKAREKKNRK